ncbi:MAG: Gfo/Idh/MocA family oxidoreductase [Planctomycetota bacterium]|jgi:predicted dehydrogenase
MHNRRISRRQFLATAASTFAFTYIPSSAWGANERFYLAGIGVGGKGFGEVRDLTRAGGTFAALCDVDDTRAGKTFKNFPGAKRYKDFRVMLEKEKGIDAVTVSTPDHTHAIASLMAMSLGKHVYCQKPLTHSIYEARIMARAADYYKVQTQMGNQAHAGEPIRRAVEILRAGIIGPVRQVHAWTNRPVWPQGQKALDERKRLAGGPKPADLDWDLWLGPAPMRDYNACYVPFKWRGWWDFGTGALGDMACHIMDMPYWALDLGSPLSVEAESGGRTTETGPDFSTIKYRFARRASVGGGGLGAAVGPKAKVSQPAVKFVWYDGNKNGRQNAPYELLEQATEEAKKSGADKQIADTGGRRKKKKPAAIDNPQRWDMILVGDDGMMLFKRSSTDWIVTPNSRAGRFAEVPKSIRRVTNEDAEWLEACKGGPKALSSFDYAGPLSEMVLLGNLAVRLGRKIEWDTKALRATNAPEADELVRREYRKGWDLTVPKAIRQNI